MQGSRTGSARRDFTAAWAVAGAAAGGQAVGQRAAVAAYTLAARGYSRRWLVDSGGTYGKHACIRRCCCCCLLSAVGRPPLPAEPFAVVGGRDCRWAISGGPGCCWPPSHVALFRLFVFTIPQREGNTTAEGTPSIDPIPFAFYSRVPRCTAASTYHIGHSEARRDRRKITRITEPRERNCRWRKSACDGGSRAPASRIVRHAQPGVRL